MICTKCLHSVARRFATCSVKETVLLYQGRSTVVSLKRHVGFLQSKNKDGTSETESVSKQTMLGIDMEPSETFGLLAEKENVQVFKKPVTDLYTELESKQMDEDTITKKNVPFWFHIECKKLGRAGKVEECYQLLATQMLQVEKVQPQEYNFSVVIGVLGRAGDIDRAFSLFYKMKDYGLTPSMDTYTSLFNCVSKSRNNKKAIENGTKLWEELKRKEILPNRFVFGSAMNAFQTHKRQEKTLEVFRDSMAAGIEPDEVTFSLLLRNCLSNSKTGFRQAIQVWKQMSSIGVKPDGQVIVSLLNVIKRCQIGEMQTALRVLLEDSGKKEFNLRRFQWLKGQESLPKPTKESSDKDKEEPLQLMGKAVDVNLTNGDSIPQTITAQPSTERSFETLYEAPVKKDVHEVQQSLVKNTTINLLTGKIPPAVLQITECWKPWQRLNLVGGYLNILALMKTNKITPSVKIYSALAEIMEPSVDDENRLMEIAEKSRTKLDVDFYNCIMKKRFQRRDFVNGEEIMLRIEKHKLEANYRTWCVYAISRRSLTLGKPFFDLLQDKKVTPDAVLMHTLITAVLRCRRKVVVGGTAIYRPDYRYLVFLVTKLRELDIKADRDLLYVLEAAADTPKDYNKWVKSDEKLESGLNHFRKIYNQWLRQVPLSAEDEDEEFCL